MNPQQFFISVIVLVLFIIFYNIYRANTRILCRYTGRDKRIKKKWAKYKNGERLEFDRGWYYVRTKCVKTETTFFNLIPTAVLEFSYLSKYPINPETGEPWEETAEERKHLNKREDIEALEVGSIRATGKQKASFMGGGWLPIILVVGVVATAYFTFQLMGRVDMLGQAINVLQQMQMGK